MAGCSESPLAGNKEEKEVIVFFWILTVLIMGLLLEALLLYLWVPFLRTQGLVGRNYLGVEIPVGVGFSFTFVLLLSYMLYMAWGWYQPVYLMFLFGFSFIAFLGFVDDMLGQRDTLGFSGHFGALFRGKLTTGGIKALGGGGAALFIALIISGPWWEILLNTLVIALFTNLLNLLDLRPGRAVKGFLFFMLVLGLIGVKGEAFFMIAPLLGAVLWYLPGDLGGRVMLGDAGSNALGFTLGFLSIMHLSLPAKSILLILLLLIHLYTEKYSLSTVIEKNNFLRWIDRIGRE